MLNICLFVVSVCINEVMAMLVNVVQKWRMCEAA